MKTSVKVASNNIICVFGKWEDINVHMANIDTRTNRIYTTGEGAKMIFSNSFIENHPIQYFEDSDVTELDTWGGKQYNISKTNQSYNKFNACIEFKKDEIQNVLNLCK